MKINRLTPVIFVLLCLFTGFSAVSAQQQEVVCGDIIQGEFTESYQRHEFTIRMGPGATFSVTAIPGGQTLRVDIAVTDVARNGVSKANLGNVTPGGSTSVETPLLASSTAYSIFTANSGLLNSGELHPFNSGFGVGIYTLQIGCTMADGSKIEPGDLPPDSGAGGGGVQQAAASFSGYGLPALPPVDFSNGVTIPLMTAQTNVGTLSPGFEGIFGFNTTLNASDVLQLDFRRESGNLNLGLAVIAADNTVVFFAGMLDAFSTTVTVPAAGEYTVGVFRVSLVPVSDPQATSFTLDAVVNP